MCMDRVFVFCLVVFIALNANGCSGQDFATYPTNPPGRPTKTPAPTTAPPTVAPNVAPTNATTLPTSIPAATTSQAIVDDTTGKDIKNTINPKPFILLIGGCMASVVLFVVLRWFRRRNHVSVRDSNKESEELGGTVDDTQYQCQNSHETHSSAATGNSSVESMVYLDAYDWCSPTRTPAQVVVKAKAKAKASRPIRSVTFQQPEADQTPPAYKGKMHLLQDNQSKNPPRILCLSPTVSTSPETASPAHLSWDAASVAYWNAGDNLCSNLGTDEDAESMCGFDEMGSTRTSSMTDSMLELVQEEL